MVINTQTHKWMGWDGMGRRLSRWLRLLRAPNGANNELSTGTISSNSLPAPFAVSWEIVSLGTVFLDTLSAGSNDNAPAIKTSKIRRNVSARHWSMVNLQCLRYIFPVSGKTCFEFHKVGILSYCCLPYLLIAFPPPSPLRLCPLALRETFGQSATRAGQGGSS